MPPTKKPAKPRRSRGSHVTRRRGAAPPAEPPPAEPPPPPHVATLIALGALGWHVTELRPSIDAPVQWRVTIKRHDGAVEIIVLDAADPDAALEELARYVAADAEEEP